MSNDTQNVGKSAGVDCPVSSESIQAVLVCRCDGIDVMLMWRSESFEVLFGWAVANNRLVYAKLLEQKVARPCITYL